MPERILGLDIGASSVKAVLLSRGLRGGYRLLAFRLVDLAAAGGLPEALEQLFADQTFRGSVCVTTLPSAALSFRNVKLPFRENRKIRQTLPFAVEPLIPAPLDEVFIDYTLVGQTDQTEIFAAVAPRLLVGERTALLAPYVRETAVIDIDAVPLALRLMEKPGFPEAALILAVGSQETTAVFTAGGRVVHVRSYPFGGETAKEPGAIAPEVAEPRGDACDRFLNELRNTQESLLWQGGLAQPPGRIILTGGGSRAAGLAERLAALFTVPVETTNLAESEGIEIDPALGQPWDPAVMDQALAMAARPMAKREGFNFRQRASEARAGYGELRNRLKRAAVAAFVVLVLAGIEIGLGDATDRLRLATLKRDITAEFKKSYPEATRIVDPLSQLRGKIAEARKLSAGMGDAASSPTVLDLLKELAGLAPPGLLLTSLNLDGDVIGIKGEVRDFDAVDTIKKALANSNRFKAVTVGSTAMTKQGGAVEFDLKITVKK
ncbi:MAG: pilus assembly protein PilM [Syntrophales bacterium]